MTDHSTFSALAHAQHSVRQYQTDLSITDTELSAIFDDVRYSPSSFNLQHWRFVVIRDKARKAQLRQLSYGQQQSSVGWADAGSPTLNPRERTTELFSSTIFTCGSFESDIKKGTSYFGK